MSLKNLKTSALTKSQQEHEWILDSPRETRAAAFSASQITKSSTESSTLPSHALHETWVQKPQSAEFGTLHAA